MTAFAERPGRGSVSRGALWADVTCAGDARTSFARIERCGAACVWIVPDGAVRHTLLESARLPNDMEFSGERSESAATTGYAAHPGSVFGNDGFVNEGLLKKPGIPDRVAQR